MEEVSCAAGIAGALAGAACSAVGGYLYGWCSRTRWVEAVTESQPQPTLKQLPLGMRLEEPFLHYLRHDAVTKYRQDYQRWRNGGAAGVHGEVQDVGVTARGGQGCGDTHELGRAGAPPHPPAALGPLSSMPALFEVDRHLEVGAVLANRPEVVEELQHRINNYRLQYRQHRQGSAAGTRSTVEKMLKLLRSAPVDLIPTTQLASLRRQQRRLAMRPRPTESESNLQLLSQVQGLHVHFGAGRLGMGLVLPAICRSRCPLAIINPPFEEFMPFIRKHKWQRPSGGNLVLLELNGEVYGQLNVVTCKQDLPSLERFLAGLDNPNRQPGPGIFAITDDKRLLFPLIAKAKTFSTSVGPGLRATSALLREVLPNLSHMHRPLLPSLSACENDHHAVEEMEGELHGRLVVASCLVDRICTSRALLADLPEEGGFPEREREPSLVRITSEPWPGLIMIPPFPQDVLASRCPFAGESVLRPRLPVEAEYITRRKISTVNGMHTTLAFLTLHAHALAKGSDFTLHLENDKLVEPEAQLGLVTVARADAAAERTIWAWAAARQLLLAYETGIEVMLMAHGVDPGLPRAERDARLCEVLWRYTRDCVLRFNTTNDTCGRVLGGGVVNRMRTRLRPVSAFLEQTPDLALVLGSFAERMLAVAGVGREEMYQAVVELSAIAERLVGEADLPEKHAAGEAQHSSGGDRPQQEQAAGLQLPEKVAASQQSPPDVYTAQLELLSGKGFTDRSRNLQGLGGA